MKRPSQATRILKLLSDGAWHSTPEIQEKVYGSTHLGTARIASRMHDLRSDGHVIDCKKDRENTTIYWYKLQLPGKDEKKERMVPIRVIRDGMPLIKFVPESQAPVQ